MTPKQFTDDFAAHAKQSEKSTGIPALAILAQAALESGWGRVAPGFAFFGIKDTDGINGNEQLLVTTEYSRRADLIFPEILSITPVVRREQKWFRYRVKDYFRQYKSPEDCFTQHAGFLLNNKRYAKAMLVRHDPYAFIEAIAKAGYATAPNYAETLKEVAKTIQHYL